MVNNIGAVKGKLKRWIANRNNFKYQRFDKPKMSESQRKSLFKNVVTIFHRLIVLFARFLFQNVFYGTKGKTVPPIKNLILLDSATTLALKIRTRKITSVEVLNAFIERIKEINPIVNCVVDERFEDARKEAEEVDKFIASGVMSADEIAEKKPFLGVPISTKDCIQVKGMLNTSGLYSRRNIKATEDAPVIAKMREAGAIPFALTNVSELCMWYESNNTIHGRTNNPYDMFRICGGSSGGEGAIQSSSASPFGIGSDIGGSIRMPAFFNGVFGHKPTRHTIPNELQYPAAFTTDQEFMLSTGPMCRFSCDLKPMLKILAHDDQLANLKLDEPVDIKKLKIFYQENDGGGFLVGQVDKDIQDALNKVVKYFKNTIKIEVSKVNISRTRLTSPIWFTNMVADGSPSFAEQIAEPAKTGVNAWIELLKWIFGRSEHTLIAIFTCLTEAQSPQEGTPKYNYLRSERDKLIDEFRELLKDDMSVFLYPTHPIPAPYHNEPVLRALNFSYTSLVNILGMPSCNIPLGLGKEGLPLGIQCVANYNNDRLCLAVASELERVFGGWVDPGNSN